MQEIDARGLSCPEPVLRVQNALGEDAAGVCVSVDNMASVENIRRYAMARGYTFERQDVEDGYVLRLVKA